MFWSNSLVLDWRHSNDIHGWMLQNMWVFHYIKISLYYGIYFKLVQRSNSIILLSNSPGLKDILQKQILICTTTIFLIKNKFRSFFLFSLLLSIHWFQNLSGYLSLCCLIIVQSWVPLLLCLLTYEKFISLTNGALFLWQHKHIWLDCNYFCFHSFAIVIN